MKTNVGSIMANLTSFNVKWFILPGLVVLGAGSLVLAQPRPAEPVVMAGSRDTACWSLAFSSDGQRLAGDFHDGSARVWEATTGKEIHTFSVEKS